VAIIVSMQLVCPVGVWVTGLALPGRIRWSAEREGDFTQNGLMHRIVVWKPCSVSIHGVLVVYDIAWS